MDQNSIERALKVYRDPKRWKPLMKRAMKQDFSMKHTARDYIALYKKIMATNEKVDG